MANVLLIRHAQSEWNAAGRWQGWADPPLSLVGRRQAEEAGQRLKAGGERFDRAVSSDLERARATATIIAGILAGVVDGLAAVGGVAAVEEVAALRELDVGDWSGLTRAQIAATWPRELVAWRAGELEAAPNGEHRSDFDERVRGGVEQVASAGSGGAVMVVAHGGVIRSVARWLGAPQGPVGHVAGFRLHPLHGKLAIASGVDLLEDGGR